MASTILKSLLLLFSLFLSLSTSSAAIPQSHLSSIESVCKSLPFPEACFNSLKLSLSINSSPNILNFLLQSLETALSQGLKLSDLFSVAAAPNLVEKQKGAIEDCRELHQISLSSLKEAMSIIATGDPARLADARALLSAALTNKNTCLEGLDSAIGSLKLSLLNSLITFYIDVSNSLSMLPKPDPPGCARRSWPPVLESLGDEYGGLTVAADGTGNFTTISEAINSAPNNSDHRTIIRIRKGVYREYVVIPTWKTNIALIGDGRDVTIITGNRSVIGGWTTFNSATVAVSGKGFLARGITFENSAGREKHQAVALRINADMAAMYRCTMTGYTDTLYVHSFRQFYRECDIYGTVDYVFGNAAVVLQSCNIFSRRPRPGQFTVITAQSRESPDQDTGISIQDCKIMATEELLGSNARSYLGRPWRNYSRTVYMESRINDFIEPEGWSVWSTGDQGRLATLYYGEYNNYGSGSSTDGRVTWPGYHVMNREEACNFAVSPFINEQKWLDSTTVPYDDGV